VGMLDGVKAGNRGEPRGRCQQPQEDAQRRGLARPVGAEEPEDLAGRDHERQVIDGDDLAARHCKLAGQMLDLDHRRLPSRTKESPGSRYGAALLPATAGTSRLLTTAQNIT